MNIDKIFKITFFSLISLEILSFIGYLIPTVGSMVFFSILAAALILSLIKLEYGLYLILAELFIGSKGYLFFLDLNDTTISIRLGLFLVVIAVWLGQRLKQKNFLMPLNNLTYYYLLFFVFIALGLFLGIKNNDFSSVFFDFNGWLYFALTFVFFDAIKNIGQLKNICQILLAATTWLAIKSLTALFLFSHGFTIIGDVFYKWLRDTGVGEITYISGTLFRVFFQSHLYLLIGFLLALTFFLASEKYFSKKNFFLMVYLYLTSLTVIVSQSRSFWLGGAAGLAFLIILSWWKFNFRIKKTIFFIVILSIMFASQLLVIQLITGNFSGNLIASRLEKSETEAAGSSRLNQLQPLTYNIFQSLFFGYGFGKVLTYQSNDPRILKTNLGGWYTTYAFEWGYLDIMLKIGLFGLISYLILIGRIFYEGVKKNKNLKLQTKNEDEKLKMAINRGFILGLIALLIINIFSPYLNHPLGIGYIMLISAITAVNS